MQPESTIWRVQRPHKGSKEYRKRPDATTKHDKFGAMAESKLMSSAYWDYSY